MRVRFVLTILTVFFLSGCVTMSGNYVVSAESSGGYPVGQGVSITAEGSGIYTARNAICSTYPGAIVHIRDAATGEELKGESPYKCR